MHRVRMVVTENRLSDPSRICEADYLRFVKSGSAWVVEGSGGEVVGFAAADESEAMVWALFVAPAAEGKGVGAALHETMLNWARARRIARLTLTTTEGTRAAAFYRRRGWSEAGFSAAGEIVFARSVDPIRTRR